MTDKRPLSFEQSQAWGVLELATTHITEEVTKRSAWLLTAVGASLTLVVSNASSVSVLIVSGSFRTALALLTASMLCGLAVQVLGSSARNALIIARAMIHIASEPHDSEAFLKAMMRGLSWPFRLSAQWRARRPNPAGFMSLIYLPARTSQRQSLWSFFQLGFAISAVFVIALGVKT